MMRTKWIITVAAVFLVALLVHTYIRVRAMEESIVEYSGCFRNLLVIAAVRDNWAYKNGKTEGDLPPLGDLEPFSVKCPRGGQYVITPIGEDPICLYCTNATCGLDGHRVIDQYAYKTVNTTYFDKVKMRWVVEDLGRNAFYSKRQKKWVTVQDMLTNAWIVPPAGFAQDAGAGRSVPEH